MPLATDTTKTVQIILVAERRPVRQDSPVEISVAEIRPVDIGADKPDISQPGIAQIGILQVCSGQIGVSQVSIAQIGLPAGILPRSRFGGCVLEKISPGR